MNRFKFKENIGLERYQLSYAYYVMVALSYVAAMFSSFIRPGIIASSLLCLIWLQLFAILYFEMKDRRMGIKAAFATMNTIDILALMYFVYNLLSVIWCTAFGMPFSVWAGEFVTGIYTMAFYIAGRIAKESFRDKFYSWFIAAVYILGVIGVVLFIWGPQFYLDYLLHADLISKADIGTMRVRMHSVTGSIQLGYISVAAMLGAVHFIMKSRGKKGKLLLLGAMLFAFLSNQRSAMVVAILVLLYINYLVFFVYRLFDKKYFAIECAAFGGVFVLMCVIFSSAIMKVYYRLVSLPGAIGQRSDQWIGAINNMSSLWLGNGLGANGHRANGISEHMIADGGLAKLFVEMGVIGTAIFIYLMILCFKYALRNLGICAAECGIIAVTLLTSIGSNILTFQLATPVFWFAVGVIGACVKDSSSRLPARVD
ncbi:MAG: hypothetical protein IKR56_05485 [Lachnospiraceae bacterium]|nr:hypothetical protein [Lachnospiraceae bacterium]